MKVDLLEKLNRIVFTTYTLKELKRLVRPQKGHSNNLEFSEFSEFLNSKIPSSKLSLFPLYGKTITRNFSCV